MFAECSVTVKSWHLELHMLRNIQNNAADCIAAGLRHQSGATQHTQQQFEELLSPGSSISLASDWEVLHHGAKPSRRAHHAGPVLQQPPHWQAAHEQAAEPVDLSSTKQASVSRSGRWKLHMTTCQTQNTFLWIWQLLRSSITLTSTSCITVQSFLQLSYGRC